MYSVGLYIDRTKNDKHDKYRIFNTSITKEVNKY